MTNKHHQRIFHWLLIVVGCCSLAVGIVGIFLPLLPTVPLLLLAAACFARSSDKFHKWLINHAQLGPMISPFLENRGLPAHAKVKAVLLLWTSLLISIFFFIPLLWVDLLVCGIGVAVSIYLIRLPRGD